MPPKNRDTVLPRHSVIGLWGFNVITGCYLHPPNCPKFPLQFFLLLNQDPIRDHALFLVVTSLQAPLIWNSSLGACVCKTLALVRCPGWLFSEKLCPSE